MLSNFLQNQKLTLYTIFTSLISLYKFDSGFESIKIYEGGSEYGGLVRNITGIYKQTRVVVPGNQMFVKFEMHSNVVASNGFKAYIHRIGINFLSL